jgi:hypothetical protein
VLHPLQRRHPASADEPLDRLYRDLLRVLRSAATQSITAHSIKLHEGGVVTHVDDHYTSP